MAPNRKFHWSDPTRDLYRPILMNTTIMIDKMDNIYRLVRYLRV